MLDPDKELELLEREFPRSRRTWLRETSAALDTQILELADNHAPYLRALHRQRQESERTGRTLDPRSNPRRRPLPDPPFSGGAQQARDSIASGASGGFYDVPAFIRRSDDEPVPPGAAKLLIVLENAEQQEWLNRIADLVRRDDTEVALFLLQKYRLKFEQ